MRRYLSNVPPRTKLVFVESFQDRYGFMKLVTCHEQEVVLSNCALIYRIRIVHRARRYNVVSGFSKTVLSDEGLADQFFNGQTFPITFPITQNSLLLMYITDITSFTWKKSQLYAVLGQLSKLHFPFLPPLVHCLESLQMFFGSAELLPSSDPRGILFSSLLRVQLFLCHHI